MEHLTISLFLTRRCSARCRHCGTWFLPKAEADFSREDIGRFIHEISKVSAFEAVGLSGGEVFVARELFSFAVDELRKSGLRYTFVTNAFWATSRAVAREMLLNYKDTIGMGLSADTFHQEFIPIERVVFASQAAGDLNIPHLIRVTMRAGETEEEMLSRLKEAGLTRFDHLQFAPLMYLGRAREELPAEDFPDDNQPIGCLSLRTPFLFSGGDLYACCGEASNIPGNHPLFLGSIHKSDLGLLIEKYDADPFLRAIYEVGPRALYDLLGEAPEGPPEELLFRSPCGTCRLIFEDERRIKRLGLILEKRGRVTVR